MNRTPDAHRYPYDHLPEDVCRCRSSLGEQPCDEGDVTLEVLALERLLGLTPPSDRVSSGSPELNLHLTYLSDLMPSDNVPPISEDTQDLTRGTR